MKPQPPPVTPETYFQAVLAFLTTESTAARRAGHTVLADDLTALHEKTKAALA